MRQYCSIVVRGKVPPCLPAWSYTKTVGVRRAFLDLMRASLGISKWGGCSGFLGTMTGRFCLTCCPATHIPAINTPMSQARDLSAQMPMIACTTRGICLCWRRYIGRGGGKWEGPLTLIRGFAIMQEALALPVRASPLLGSNLSHFISRLCLSAGSYQQPALLKC